MDVNPTSDVIVYPWYVKNFPVTVSWDYTAGDQFTLMVYDVGYLITHAVYTNIQGNDMTSADVCLHYKCFLGKKKLNKTKTKQNRTEKLASLCMI
jgi:hypothetical protein